MSEIRLTENKDLEPSNQVLITIHDIEDSDKPSSRYDQASRSSLRISNNSGDKKYQFPQIKRVKKAFVYKDRESSRSSCSDDYAKQINCVNVSIVKKIPINIEGLDHWNRGKL